MRFFLYCVGFISLNYFQYLYLQNGSLDLKYIFIVTIYTKRQKYLILFLRISRSYMWYSINILNNHLKHTGVKIKSHKTLYHCTLKKHVSRWLSQWSLYNNFEFLIGSQSYLFLKWSFSSLTAKMCIFETILPNWKDAMLLMNPIAESIAFGLVHGDRFKTVSH